MDMIFIPTPIDVKPEKEGFYITIGENSISRIFFSEEYGWGTIPQTHSHFLKPVSKSEYDRDRGVEFANWIEENKWWCEEGLWSNTAEWQNITTKELYEQFTKEKEGQKILPSASDKPD